MNIITTTPYPPSDLSILDEIRGDVFVETLTMTFIAGFLLPLFAFLPAKRFFIQKCRIKPQKRLTRATTVLALFTIE